MKTAIWIDNTTRQLVLTPENDIERAIIRDLAEMLKDRSDFRHFLYAGAEHSCGTDCARELSWDKRDLIIRVGEQPRRGANP